MMFIKVFLRYYLEQNGQGFFYVYDIKCVFYYCVVLGECKKVYVEWFEDLCFLKGN